MVYRKSRFISKTTGFPTYTWSPLNDPNYEHFNTKDRLMTKHSVIPIQNILPIDLFVNKTENPSITTVTK